MNPYNILNDVNQRVSSDNLHQKKLQCWQVGEDFQHYWTLREAIVLLSLTVITRIASRSRTILAFRIFAIRH